MRAFPLSRRPPVTERQRDPLDATACGRDGGLGRWRRRRAPRRRAPGCTSPRPRTLTRAPLRRSPAAHQHLGGHTSTFEGGERVQVDRGVGHAERVLEPAQLGDPLHEWELATLEPGRHRARACWPLHTPPGGLAALAGDAAPDPVPGAPGPRRGRESCSLTTRSPRLQSGGPPGPPCPGSRAGPAGR